MRAPAASCGMLASCPGHKRPGWEVPGARWECRDSRGRRSARASASNSSEPSGTSTRRQVGSQLAVLGSVLSLPLSLVAPGPSGAVQLSEDDLAFTHKVYLDVSMCETAVSPDRTLGAENIFCTDPLELGRIEMGLFGNLVPTTVANFVAAVRSGSYEGTAVQRIDKGQYFLAGKAGSKRMGEVEAPQGLQAKNSDLISSKSFVLQHTRPGTVSLYLGDPEAAWSGKANLEFAVTTGPGPANSLDDAAVVFGRVTRGMDVVQAIASTPTFAPNDNIVSFNKFASLLGDDRAKRARASWGKPRRAVLISASGMLDVAASDAS